MTIQELEKYFADNPPPPTPINLSAGTRITNQKAFVYKSLSLLTTGHSQRFKMPYLKRLLMYYELITTK